MIDTGSKSASAGSRAKRATVRMLDLLRLWVHGALVRCAWVPIPLALSCGLRADCNHDNQGQTFELRINKRLSSACGVPAQDPLIGKSFRFRVEGFSPGDTCDCGAGTILNSPSDRTWSDAAPQTAGHCTGGFFGVNLNEQLGDCASEVQLSVHADGPGSADLDDPTPVPRLDYTSTCDCGGSFNITLQRVDED